jgi:hypothetical protein
MIGMWTVLLKAVSTVALAAGTPVAVVEDVTGSPPGIQFMDYVDDGQVIHLGPQDTIVFGYLKSCWHETITGGTVTVGTEQSQVQGGKVDRAKVPCEGGKMQLTAELAKSAAMVFRDRPQPTHQTPHPQFTLYGLSPVVEIRPGGTLVIDRVDQPGEHHEVATSGVQLVRGVFLDLAKAGVVLSPGGIYRATAGAQQIVFKIDSNAQAGNAPIVGRLLRLQPAS